MRYFPIVWESNVFQEYIFFFSELKARELLSRKNDASGRACQRFPKIIPILVAYYRHIKVQATPDREFRIFLNLRGRLCWTAANLRGGISQLSFQVTTP